MTVTYDHNIYKIGLTDCREKNSLLYKTFLPVIVYCSKLECFFIVRIISKLDQYLQARVKPTLRADSTKGFHSGRLPALPSNVSLGWEATDNPKHSSLLLHGINYGRKSFMAQIPGFSRSRWSQSHKTFCCKFTIPLSLSPLKAMSVLNT